MNEISDLRMRCLLQLYTVYVRYYKVFIILDFSIYQSTGYIGLPSVASVPTDSCRDSPDAQASQSQPVSRPYPQYY